MSQQVSSALRSGLVGGLALLVVGLLASDRAPANTARAQVGVDSSFEPLCVDLDAPLADDAFRWEAETTGMLLALLEGGFAMLDDTTVRVGSSPPPPGRPVCGPDAERWRASLEVAGSDDALRGALWLCDEDGRCRVLDAQGTPDAPEDVARALLDLAADVLDRDPELALAWAVPQSRDPYAELLAGRSSAAFYGLIPGLMSDDEDGGSSRDPIRRAALVDPLMPVAEWMVARRALLTGDGDRALGALVRGDPDGIDPVDLALAVVHARYGDARAAVARWEAVQEAMPEDRRVTLERVEALIHADRLADAREALDGMPDDMVDLPRYLELAVAWKEASDLPLHPDGLLALWQVRAPDDPRPVSKRIETMVRVHRYDDALALTEDLETRGLIVAARRLRVALAAELGDWSVASGAARALGDPQLASVLAGEPIPPTGRPELLEAEQAVVLDSAREALAAGAPERAVESLEGLLDEDPWDPEALALQAAALVARGDDEGARRVRCRLHRVDPGWDGLDPTSADALALARRCEVKP